MNEEVSIKRQRSRGTLDRNELIKTLYRPGLGGILGKQFPNRKTGKPLSRQRIHQILRLPSPQIAYDNAHDSKLGRFRGWLRGFISLTKKLWHNSREA